MDSYQQLQSEFKLVEDRKMDEKTQMDYQQLFNSLRAQTGKRRSVRDKMKLQRSSLHRSRSKFIEINSKKQLQKSLNESWVSNISGVDFMEKKTILEFQKQALMQEMDNLGKVDRRMNQDKIIAKEELKLLTNKETECASIINQLTGVLQSLQTKINEQKAANKSQFKFYQDHVSSLTKKLQELKSFNIQQSSQYKQLKQSNVEQHNINFLGSILHWTNEENKIKMMEKKIFTKAQLEMMLRSLYIVGKLAGLNYGNIIEHLIKIAESSKRITSNKNFFLMKNGTNSNQYEMGNQQDIYTDLYGDELPIINLIQKIDSQLLSKVEMRLLSKQQTIQYYAKQGIVISSQSGFFASKSTPNLSSPTSEMINKIIQHHEKLTSWFSRIEKRNQQLSQYYQSLLKIDDDLQKEIRTIEMSSQQKSIHYLQARQGEICKLQDRVHDECKIIFQFNINMYNLIKRFSSLNKFFDQLVKSADIKSKKYKKTYVEVENDDLFLKNITKTLFKSPQSIILDWNKVIKSKNMVGSTMTIQNSKNSMRSSSDGFQSALENEVYYNTVMRNDLLRIYAQPSMYDSGNSYLGNLQSTFNYVMREETEIVKRLCGILKGLLVFSKEGIEEVERINYIKPESVQKTTRTQYTVDSKISRDQQDTVNKLSPLIRLFQQSKTQLKVDKFFLKDGIKQEESPKEQQTDDQEKENQNQSQKKPQESKEEAEKKQDNFCVQSNDFYRRDDFKIIEKLERLNLKKKGLLPNVSFFNDTTLEMEQQAKPLNHALTQKQSLRLVSARNSLRNISPRFSHQMIAKRNNMLSERRQRESFRKRELKTLLGNISTITLQNQKYRIKRKTHLNETMTSMSISRVNSQIAK